MSLDLEKLSKIVEYHPEWRTQLRLFVDDENWPEVRPFVTQCKLQLGESVEWSNLGHTVEDRPGVRFGSVDREIERKIAKVLDLYIEPNTSSTTSSQSDYDEPVSKFVVPDDKVVDHRRATPERPGPQNKYPFAALTQVGDHFLVKGAFPRISSVCIYWNRKFPGRIYRSVTVPEGVLVVLVRNETGRYDIEV